MFLRLASLAVLVATLYQTISCSDKDTQCNVGQGSCDSHRVRDRIIYLGELIILTMSLIIGCSNTWIRCILIVITLYYKCLFKLSRKIFIYLLFWIIPYWFQCWETYVGQSFYKLAVLNFLVHVAVTLLYELPRRYDYTQHIFYVLYNNTIFINIIKKLTLCCSIKSAFSQLVSYSHNYTELCV